MVEAAALEGVWEARKVGACAWGYRARWVVTAEGDALTVAEQPGSGCCGCVPNCILKTHRLSRASEREWRGTLCYKPVGITVKSDDELSHMTTDGLMVMTRLKE